MPLFPAVAQQRCTRGSHNGSMQNELTPRCAWAGHDPLMRAYHDDEWGAPTHTDRKLFEMLILEGAQAGLSWSTILNKRSGYRAAFAEFDPVAVAQFTPQQCADLLTNLSIVRNRLKIQAAVRNAQAFLRVQAEFATFDTYLWRFVNGQPVQNAWAIPADVPASTGISDALSRDLRKRGFTFVGSTICYAFMQSVGMVNGHLTSCFRHVEVAALP
jgi:DNA-3-methyladenine glycosylase I